jgi:CRP-like cAMP-binding protein
VEDGIVIFSVAGANGHAYSPSFRSRGAIIGAACAIAEEPYPFAIVTKTEARLRLISSREFLHLLHDDATVSRFIHRIHAREINEQIFGMSSLALLSVRQRLEEFLFQLLPNLEEIRGRFRLPFSDVDLTQFLSASPQYLSNTFRQLERDGVVRRCRGWLTVKRTELWHRERSARE